MSEKDKPNASPPPKYEADFIAETARHLGVLEGKVDIIIQRLDNLADSYKTLNHNSTQITARLNKLEQRQIDADRQRTRIFQIIGIIVAAFGALATYLTYVRIL